MKLRILGNSIRIRLSQDELSRLSETGQVSDAIVFGAGCQLGYSLEVDSELEVLRASFSDSQITVSLPKTVAETWTSTDQVSLHGEQTLPEGELTILVEKDFRCLDPRLHEDESGLFPHPEATG